MSYTKFPPPLDRQVDRTSLNTFKAQGLFQQGYSYKNRSKTGEQERGESRMMKRMNAELVPQLLAAVEVGYLE